MSKVPKKRLQVVITKKQDAMLTEAAYGLSNTRWIYTKSEVVRLAIEHLSMGLKSGEINLDKLANLVDQNELEEMEDQ
ncbi:MAG: transcriptional regulator [Deinococcaceae bacterium]